MASCTLKKAAQNWNVGKSREAATAPIYPLIKAVVCLQSCSAFRETNEEATCSAQAGLSPFPSPPLGDMNQSWCRESVLLPSARGILPLCLCMSHCTKGAGSSVSWDFLHGQFKSQYFGMKNRSGNWLLEIWEMLLKTQEFCRAFGYYSHLSKGYVVKHYKASVV